jgi:hypothetical protein
LGTKVVPRRPNWLVTTLVHVKTSTNEKHALMSTSPTATAPLGKHGGFSDLPASNASGSRKKIKMSQSVVIDLDANKKSDRAEVAMLHADIVHNARNA